MTATAFLSTVQAHVALGSRTALQYCISVATLRSPGEQFIKHDFFSTAYFLFLLSSLSRACYRRAVICPLYFFFSD
jgi:hypothetical protein